MNITKKVLKSIGKYLVFGLLMGLGSMVLTDMIILPHVRDWAWLLGMPKEGSTYYAIVQVVLWSLWGFVGVMLAVSVYPMIFKEPPARWMFITDLSISSLNWILGALAIGFGVWLGEIKEIDLDTWKRLCSYQLVHLNVLVRI
jgi:hypothetical protein